MKRLWLIEFFANALIVFGFYQWLGVRDSRTSQLLLSLALALALIAGTVWLHSRTFNMKPLRFAILAFLFLIICWGLSALPLDRFAVWVASSLTYRSRKPFSPATMTRIFVYARWFLQWIVVPLLLLQKRRPLFWLQYTGVVLIAFVLPGLLIHWVPKLTSTAAQVTSFVLRFSVAYCLAITGFVAFWRFTSSGRPPESQPSTASFP